MRIFILLPITTCLALGCREPSNSIATVPQDSVQYETNTSAEIGNEIEIKIATEEAAIETGCDFEDGKHSATVDYFNPKTGHRTKYELEVHVEDCKIVQIDFPNGGWLDEDHMPQTQINRNREVVFKDDKGRQWKIHLQ